jgi:glycosyltransferase involved in cell wall biosynthesis
MSEAVNPSKAPPRLAVWGTYDTGKPRVRMLIEAAQRLDPGLVAVNRNPWAGVEDKSQVRGIFAWLRLIFSWIASYPILIYSYLRLPRHDVVIVPYLGNLDVLLLWPFARLRGARICWDMFISLYDTVVEDRQMLAQRGWLARLLHWTESLSVRAADLVLMDTQEHAHYVAGLYKAPLGKIQAAWVGAETNLFAKTPLPARQGPVQVLFYGQFIPLHGLDTLVTAIAQIQAQAASPELHFTIIGSGQESARIDQLITEQGLRNIERIAWVDYAELPARIADADICLGIFAEDGKVQRVIPNKAFQILAVGRPLITSDSPAMRELVQPGEAIRLTRPGDPASLAEQLMALAQASRDPARQPVLAAAAAQMPAVDVETIAAQLRVCLESLA